MILTTARIAPLSGSPILDADAMHARLWDHRLPSDGVELIRIRAGPHGLDIAGFILAPRPDDAYETLRRLVERTIAADPDLYLWRVI